MNYFKVLGFQLEALLDCDSRDEFLVLTDSFKEQMNSVKDIIDRKKPDIIIMPEMCYLDSMKSYYLDISKNSLVIAGSKYYDGINKTMVYFQNKEFVIPKCNASGSEPMVRNVNRCSVEKFMKCELQKHIFYVQDKMLVILNCMEYYQNAYYIAREVRDLFGMVCICSNNNPKVFLEESRAIHNHCENVYTFMVNLVSTYQGEPYGKGVSYVYGPIQGHEREWLSMEGVLLDEHNSSILKLGSEAEYFYGEFVNNFSRFGRSDEYLNNPKNIEVGMIRKRVL